VLAASVVLCVVVSVCEPVSNLNLLPFVLCWLKTLCQLYVWGHVVYSLPLLYIVVEGLLRHVTLFCVVHMCIGQLTEHDAPAQSLAQSHHQVCLWPT
jgi:hypothetical protein